MGRRRHSSRSDHFLPSLLADQAHVQLVRADFLAQAAQAAGIDELVGIPSSHNDGKIVVNLSNIFFGIVYRSYLDIHIL